LVIIRHRLMGRWDGGTIHSRRAVILVALETGRPLVPY
jgi:hypothetical protein